MNNPDSHTCGSNCGIILGKDLADYHSAGAASTSTTGADAALVTQ